MSGPRKDAEFGLGAIEVREGRTTQIGDLGIVRVLPTKNRRTIGPWCFVDLMRSDDIAEPPPLEIGPHPHIGLSTVTWLFAGSALHSDSLGTQQVIRPGELNLMTSGHGIAHAELGLDTEAVSGPGGFMGVQMWIAQDEGSRHGSSRFEHLAELPIVDLTNGEASLLVGDFGGASSGATADHPAVGLDITVAGFLEIEAEQAFEYGVVPIDVPIKVEDVIVEPGSLGLVPVGHNKLTLETKRGVGRVMLIGGQPLGEPIKMWWNFVARSQDELTQAWVDWDTGDEQRFGPVPSKLERVDSPRPPWLGGGPK